MRYLLQSLSLALVLALTTPGTAMAYFIECGPNTRSLFHISQYGSFYVQPNGQLSYQYFNDMQDKKTVDPRCVRFLGREIPIYKQPVGF